MKHCRFHVTYQLNPNRGKDVKRKGWVIERNAVRELANIRRPCSTGPDGWAIPLDILPFVPSGDTTQTPGDRQA